VAAVVEQHEVPIGNVVEECDTDLERHHPVVYRPWIRGSPVRPVDVVDRLVVHQALVADVDAQIAPDSLALAVLSVSIENGSETAIAEPRYRPRSRQRQRP